MKWVLSLICTFPFVSYQPKESILCPVQWFFYHNDGVQHGSVLGPILFIFYHNDGVPHGSVLGPVLFIFYHNDGVP